MQVSVLIPVYNAADFVRQAVESALLQPETSEIILVEDGSSDHSLDVCRQLAAEHDKVHLYRHADGKNHGAGATRNLAITKSSCEYLAFLDADDYYLPQRFAAARKLFESDGNVDGVYDAIAMHIENDAGSQRWEAAGRAPHKLHTMFEYVPPERLFAALVGGGVGSFSLDGLVVKRSVIEKSGFMDEDLPLHQDSALMVKMAAVSRLVPGKLDEPAAMWRVHDHNRISAPRPKSQIYKQKINYWLSLLKWGRVYLNLEQQRLLSKALIDEARSRTRFNRPFHKSLYGLQRRIQLLLLSLQYPSVMREPYFWRVVFPSPVYWYSRSRIKSSDE